MRAVFALTALSLVTFVGCSQVRVYAPEKLARTYSLNGWPRNMVVVEMQDFRSDLEESEKLQAVIFETISQALPPPASAAGADYRLRISIVEHRSYFTLGNWNASTKLRAALVDPGGKVLKTWSAAGIGHRSNMWGYWTAESVSNDAFNIAISDLLAQLDGDPNLK